MAKQRAENTNTPSFIPPVVAVLGHVDHGKTSLLDSIRKTGVAEREFGGITQKIGASTVEITHEGVTRDITFIDTPGHEAFSKMRGRGAQAADIGLLIISAVDGIKPQTKESIELLKSSKIPYIVVITKVDLPTKNIEQTKQQLIGEGILLEGLGGDIPVIEVSSKTGHNVKELLDLILLVWDIRSQAQKKDEAPKPLRAIVIEARLDPKSGPRATVVVKSGILRVREEIQLEGVVFKIRTLITDKGEHVTEVSEGYGVEVLGMPIVPAVGTIITDKHAASQDVFEDKRELKKDLVYQNIKRDDENKLPIILCTDNQGSLEAITYSLPEDVKIISRKTGEITEADILMGKSTGALVLGFNVKIRPDVAKLAQTEKVLAKNYQIIYEMLDEVKDVLEGKQLALLEEIYGTAQIKGKFPFDKKFAYGIQVLDGRVARSDKLRIMRGDEIVGETTFSSLRVGKNSISKVEKGHEAGVVFSHDLDITIGDMLLCHS